MSLRTCVDPEGRFVYGIHRPSFRVANQRENDSIGVLGFMDDGTPVTNERNFPAGSVRENSAAWIYEIPNPFPFRGTTYIKKDWADRRAEDPFSIRLAPLAAGSLSESISKLIGSSGHDRLDRAFRELPETVLLAAAATSSDPDDLVRLAKMSCHFHYDDHGEPTGLRYGGDRPAPLIDNHPLFEALVNNPSLPDSYKVAMVLKPGVQGGSEIVGEIGPGEGSTHVYEYLRRNSYIAWGHYASNMAEDAVRYSLGSLSDKDMRSLRHLYYQRTFIRLAEDLGLAPPAPNARPLATEELEGLRLRITELLDSPTTPPPTFTATLWGWNYGFDFAPSGYRLHASHQQIHQQYALLPGQIDDNRGGELAAYGCGDLVADFAGRFQEESGRGFFESYLAAIRANARTDGRTDRPASLVVHEDENVMLFVPKAQTSQWELQLVCLAPVGNILEADAATRGSLDRAILLAMRAYDRLGARMVTTIEFPKRFDSPDHDQRLLYSFLPKLPESPGAFSEAQLRWINGHYPEDFAIACREAAGQGG